MHKKFEINPTKIKGGCQSGRKVVPHDSKTDFNLNHPTSDMEFISIGTSPISDVLHINNYLPTYLLF